ncbi:MAG: UDP-N-acetylmuramoyl-L-alanine--D-glutamate ligase [Rickettsiaceae bacterium]
MSSLFTKELLNKSKIGIFGLSRTGIATYRYLKDLAQNCICFDDDKNKIQDFINQYDANHIANLSNIIWKELDMIVISPGISHDHEIFHFGQKYNIKIVSDIDIFYNLLNPKKIVGITGTNGKSTTTKLITHIMQSAGKDYVNGGNIGIAAMDLDPNKAGYILELSSFQLDLINDLRLDVGVLLNITPDHLDRYSNMMDYINSKKKIASIIKPEGFLIICTDNSLLHKIYQELLFDQNYRNINILPLSSKIKSLSRISTQYGLHPENIAASHHVCQILGVNSSDIKKYVTSFKQLKYRMEHVGSYHNNIHFYNDSKATNTVSSIYALTRLDNIYWLIGGIFKEADISRITPYLYRVNKIYIFGRDKLLLSQLLMDKASYILCENMSEAFNLAVDDAKNNLAKEDKNILLSPMSASTDQFKNFEDRGNKFTELCGRFIH